MSRSAYGKRICFICGRQISVAGFAWVSHQRKHVREGLVREIHFDRPFRGIRFEQVKPAIRRQEIA